MRHRIFMRSTQSTKQSSTYRLEVVEGGLPRRAMALMLEWAQEHRSELMEDWDLCSRNQSPKKIQPLP
jgi:Domain of unknown function (DUF4160)